MAEKIQKFIAIVDSDGEPVDWGTLVQTGMAAHKIQEYVAVVDGVTGEPVDIGSFVTDELASNRHEGQYFFEDFVGRVLTQEYVLQLASDNGNVNQVTTGDGDFDITTVNVHPAVPGAERQEVTVTVSFTGLTEDSWFAAVVRATTRGSSSGGGSFPPFPPPHATAVAARVTPVSRAPLAIQLRMGPP